MPEPESHHLPSFEAIILASRTPGNCCDIANSLTNKLFAAKAEFGAVTP
jgi:hypothetical protein